MGLQIFFRCHYRRIGIFSAFSNSPWSFVKFSYAQSFSFFEKDNLQSSRKQTEKKTKSVSISWTSTNQIRLISPEFECVGVYVALGFRPASPSASARAAEYRPAHGWRCAQPHRQPWAAKNRRRCVNDLTNLRKLSDFGWLVLGYIEADFCE